MYLLNLLILDRATDYPQFPDRPDLHRLGRLLTLKDFKRHGHELSPLPLWSTHLWVLELQDTSGHNPLHDLPSASANSPYSSLSRRNAHHSHRSQAFNGQHGRAYLFDGVCVQIPHVSPKLSAYPALFHARALVPMTASAHAKFGNLCSATLLRSSLLAFLLSPLPQCERDRG